MKKLLLILTLGLFLFDSYAQEFKAGAIAGAAFSQVEGDTYTGFNRIGLAGGLYVSRSFSELWEGQLEIVYKQKGSRHTPNESKGDYSLYKLNLNYIEVPLLVKLKVNEISFEAGAAFGTLIHSSEEDENGTITSIYPFEDHELSGIVGVSYKFRPRMLVNLRWSAALTRARKAYGGAFDHQKPVKWLGGKFGQYNHCFSLSLYYEFEGFMGN
ncbi:Outer membrane protein beta-barrel domain-containing protein [Saccharicrinis carchari]|uniref:Outer membrane protein beta-barrel domain-containing protein n=1 Tax=Saccharicrinis carchari TaxID=1168039 RepID=A0A521CMC8_SACCC|nr:porin family protein [Saccharicrinis carchari]SMO60599.1 Outer membrane protein beta-barrel domain-containing protein [Saccharicrinis carchari]